MASASSTEPRWYGLDRAGQEVEQELPRIAVAERLQRQPAQHLPAELHIGEAVLVGGVGDQAENFARILAAVPGLAGEQEIEQLAVAAEDGALPFELGAGEDRPAAEVAIVALRIGRPPQPLQIVDREQDRIAIGHSAELEPDIDLVREQRGGRRSGPHRRIIGRERLLIALQPMDSAEQPARGIGIEPFRVRLEIGIECRRGDCDLREVALIDCGKLAIFIDRARLGIVQCRARSHVARGFAEPGVGGVGEPDEAGASFPEAALVELPGRGRIIGECARGRARHRRNLHRHLGRIAIDLRLGPGVDQRLFLNGRNIGLGDGRGIFLPAAKRGLAPGPAIGIVNAGGFVGSGGKRPAFHYGPRQLDLGSPLRDRIGMANDRSAAVGEQQEQVGAGIIAGSDDGASAAGKDRLVDAPFRRPIAAVGRGKGDRTANSRGQDAIPARIPAARSAAVVGDRPRRHHWRRCRLRRSRLVIAVIVFGITIAPPSTLAVSGIVKTGTPAVS